MSSSTQSTVSKHNSLDDGLGKAKAKSRYWERKAKEGTERAMGKENERDEPKEEAQITRLAAVTAGDARAWVENGRARVRDSLAVAEEAKSKAKAEITSLKVERKSLLLELGAEKNEVSFFQSQASKDKEAMKEDY